MTKDFRYVKITLYENYHSPLCDVVYYRHVEFTQLLKYKWYFEYLAAIVKVKHPHGRVKLAYGETDLLFGDDYINAKRKNLISYKKGRISKLEKLPDKSNLFDDGSEKKDKINRLKNEITNIEKGIINFYVPPVYINKIKQQL